ncbi:MAG TPA: DUF1294 domain-containing protein [Methanomassiliicoccaceae archaeon]|nr:DUF1294 domain-containing protein [Methanomassiliicoccaceae archaeon]HOQ25521.1 DUF1294 domain-containing protein [Methanomassiliicoccaceae archaeon]HPT73492.1 DUF1294 domain-containing protein [Methanomassiliicoccaceae archaeon]HQA20604.1 DUF1294 domain-containing protein [Methanomassiliicoccaceae archaeon]HQD87082.1 DUF1294 domain-containing protein [Methanomassiliicoccaceae archaeon]
MTAYLWMPYVIINVVAFMMYGVDKLRSKGRRRTRERTLLAAALVGPFGALAAMRLFRHKTRKPKFFLVPIFLALHLVVVVLLIL